MYQNFTCTQKNGKESEREVRTMKIYSTAIVPAVIFEFGNYKMEMKTENEIDADEVVKMIIAVNENFTMQEVAKLGFMPYRDSGGKYSVFVAADEKGFLYEIGGRKFTEQTCQFLEAVFKLFNSYWQGQ